MNFSNYISNYRKENNINLSEFQEVTGVPQEHLKLLEEGKELPTSNVIHMIAVGMSHIDGIRSCDVLHNLKGYIKKSILI